MTRSAQFRQVIGVGCLLVAALGLSWPGGPPATAEGGSGRIVPGLLDPGRRLSELLDQRLADQQRKVALKDAALAELLAGHRTLAETVTRHQVIEDQFPGLAEPFRRALQANYPGCRYEECLARSILAQSEAWLQDEPEQAGRVLPRLRTELAAYARQE
jgi:hypothetical protein